MEFSNLCQFRINKVLGKIQQDLRLFLKVKSFFTFKQKLRSTMGQTGKLSEVPEVLRKVNKLLELNDVLKKYYRRSSMSYNIEKGWSFLKFFSTIGIIS